MACASEKTTAGAGLFGLIGNVVFQIYKGKAGLSIATPFSVLGAILRGLAAAENLETCLELQGVDVSTLRERRQQLQREVEDLQRIVSQQPAGSQP